MALSVLSGPVTSLLTTLTRVKAELGITVTTTDEILFDMIHRASSAITKECGWPTFGAASYQETVKGSGSQLLPLSAVPILSVSQVVQGTALTQDGEVIDPTDPDLGYAIETDDQGLGIALYRPCGWSQTPNLLSWGWQAYSSRYILAGGSSSLRYTVTYTAGYFLPAQEPHTLKDTATGNDPLYDPTSGVTLDTAVPSTLVTIPPVLNRPATVTDAPPLPGAVEQACLETVKAWWFNRARDATIASKRSEEQAVSYFAAAGQTGALPTVAMGLIRDFRRVA